MFNLRQVNNSSTDTGLSSHLLDQLQEHKDIEDIIVHGERVPGTRSFEGATFGNLNLDAFDKVMDSPTDSDSSTNTSQVKAPSLEGVCLHDVHSSAFDLSDSSTDHSQISSENDIQEVR